MKSNETKYRDNVRTPQKDKIHSFYRAVSRLLSAMLFTVRLNIYNLLKWDHLRPKCHVCRWMYLFAYVKAWKSISQRKEVEEEEHNLQIYTVPNARDARKCWHGTVEWNKHMNVSFESI